MMSFTDLSSPFLILSKRSFKDTEPDSSFCAASLRRRSSASSLANFSSATTSMMSPASGTSSQPVTETGVEGPAFFTFLPLSSVMARILPVEVPATTLSPIFKVPVCTRMVATLPTPLSRRASMMVPRAGRSGLALSSRISAMMRMFSRRLSTPSPVFAETRTTGVSPPHSSGRSS